MAPSKCDGAGSSCMGVAHYGEGSVFRSMLVLGRTAGYCVGMRYRSPRKALEQCNAIRHSFGRAEQYACVAAPQRFSFEPSRINPALIRDGV